jgi:hypothetical protein
MNSDLTSALSEFSKRSDDHSHLAQVRGADLGIEGGSLSIGEMTTMPVVDLRPTERTPGPRRGWGPLGSLA